MFNLSARLTRSLLFRVSCLVVPLCEGLASGEPLSTCCSEVFPPPISAPVSLYLVNSTWSLQHKHSGSLHHPRQVLSPSPTVLCPRVCKLMFRSEPFFPLSVHSCLLLLSCHILAGLCVFFCEASTIIGPLIVRHVPGTLQKRLGPSLHRYRQSRVGSVLCFLL